MTVKMHEEIPEEIIGIKREKRGRWVLLFDEFFKSKNKCMELTFNDKQEAIRCRSSATSYAYNYGVKVSTHLKDNVLYVIKKEK